MKISHIYYRFIGEKKSDPPTSQTLPQIIFIFFPQKTLQNFGDLNLSRLNSENGKVRWCKRLLFSASFSPFSFGCQQETSWVQFPLSIPPCRHFWYLSNPVVICQVLPQKHFRILQNESSKNRKIYKFFSMKVARKVFKNAKFADFMP